MSTTDYIERWRVREEVLAVSLRAGPGIFDALLVAIDAIPIATLEDPEPGTFRPTPAARAVLRRMPCLIEPMLDEFYALWEAEGDPRRAASMIAARYLWSVARIAIFGTVCDGVEPNAERWREVAMEQFQSALLDVHNAFKDAIEKPQGVEEAS